ncbi:MAG: hypothetical protein ABI361_02325 [Nitrososphaera sp.]
MTSIADLFVISDSDSVQDAWLTTVNLLDMLERANGVVESGCDLGQVRLNASKVLEAAEAHMLDDSSDCGCGLSNAEHALLKRKILTFFRLQVENLKHLVSG